jgi:hypothetical protein
VVRQRAQAMKWGSPRGFWIAGFSLFLSSLSRFGYQVRPTHQAASCARQPCRAQHHTGATDVDHRGSHCTLTKPTLGSALPFHAVMPKCLHSSSTTLSIAASRGTSRSTKPDRHPQAPPPLSSTRNHYHCTPPPQTEVPHHRAPSRDVSAIAGRAELQGTASPS